MLLRRALRALRWPNPFQKCLATAPAARPGGLSDHVHALNGSLEGHNASVDPFGLIADDLRILTRSMMDSVAVAEHPVLNRAAEYFLAMQGKRFRPVIVVLMARATGGLGAPLEGPEGSRRIGPGDLLPGQLRLAEITEMIHTASLLHDDVIDVSEVRRGVGSVNSVFGNQLAVLAGDFLLARASVSLARLRDCDVVELLSTVIEHLVRGEVIQIRDDRNQNSNSSRSVRELFEDYMAKSFYKTASLIANSCRAVTMLAGHSARVVEAAYEYGKNVGIAFQLVDDVLDMTGTSEILGKPALNDLAQGVATAPVLFALELFPGLRSAIERRFKGTLDVGEAVTLVKKADGIAKTRELAREHAEKAVLALARVLPPSDYRSALINVVDRVLLRQR